MKILIVSQYFWPESFVINSLATELVERGHEVTVYTGLPNYPQGEFYQNYGLTTGPWNETYNGVNIIRVPILPRKTGFLKLLLNYLSFVFFGSLLAVFRVRKQVDVIFCFGLSPALLCIPAIIIKWIYRRPLVFWVQDLWPESIGAVGAIKSKLVLNVVGQIVRFIYSQCDMILTQSRVFKASVIRWGGRENKIHYVPNWADPLKQEENPTWVDELPPGFRIGFAGNIGKAQDMATLLSAAELLREHTDIKWIIAGDGSEKKWLDDEIVKRELSASVITVGKKPYAEMGPFFSVCDALYVSLTNEYIFSLTVPSKVQAYMSARKPILSCLNGEGAQVITEAQCGLVAGAEKANELAQNVLKLKNLSVSEREEMGLNGLRYFEQNFERSLVVAQIEKLLSKAISARQKK